MSHIAELLDEAAACGLVVALDNGRLRVNGPDTPEAATILGLLGERRSEIVAALAHPLPPLADGYERILLNEGDTDPVLIVAPYAPEDLTNPGRNESWAPKRQLAQEAADLFDLGVRGKEAFHMATYGGYTAAESGYIAKLIRTGEWRAMLEQPSVEVIKPKRTVADLLQEQVYA